MNIRNVCFIIEVIKASEHDYLSTISELQINSQYAAAFMNGRIQLHMVRKPTHFIVSKKEILNFRLKNLKNIVKNVILLCFH